MEVNFIEWTIVFMQYITEHRNHYIKNKLTFIWLIHYVAI